MIQIIRVLVVNEYASVRQDICKRLSQDHSIQVVGEAADGVQATRQAELLNPDVVLVDLEMSKLDRIEPMWRLSIAQPNGRVLILMSHATDAASVPAIQASSLGYLLQDSSPTDLIRAIHQVHQDHSAVDSALPPNVTPEMPLSENASRAGSRLTKREKEMLRLIARGKSNQGIADELAIAENTVSKHVCNILSKLNLASRTQVALYALKAGLASVDDIPTRWSE